MPIPTRPSADIDWATNEGLTVADPGAGRKATGWTTDKPPYQHFNWWMNYAYKWQIYFDRLFANANMIQRSVSGSFNLPERSSILVCNTTAGNQTIVLPSAASNDGLEFTIKKITGDANTVTIQGTVDADVNPILEFAFTSVTVFAYNGSWYFK